MKLTINNIAINAPSGSTLLEAALVNNIYIPNLCYHPELPCSGACRLCIVQIDKIKGFPTACTTKAEQGMVVFTNTSQIENFRKNILWFILSEHPKEILESTQLKKIAQYIGIKNIKQVSTPNTKNIPLITDEPLFKRDMNRCILCGRCVSICQETRKAGILGFINRGIDTTIGTNYDLSLKDSNCRFCLACVEVCPSGALQDTVEFTPEEKDKVLLPCTNTCPANIDAARYIAFIAEGKFQEALDVVREKVPFPKTLGYVCDHPCEEECRRLKVNEPIAIRALKRFAAEKDSGSWRKKIKLLPKTGKRIAIVGSGPAGLTAAWFLQKLGHQAVVFEVLPEAGGMMRSGIPAYRLPRSVLDQEIKEIKNIGVKIKVNTKIESFEWFTKQGFNALFLAVGAACGLKMGIPGDNDPRVLDGISLLRDINSGKKIDLTEKITVVGGGNVAIDVARSALRAGVKKVEIIYRRTRKEMPALEEEVEEAEKEGVDFKFLVNPQKIIPQNDRLKVECIKMKLGEPDASGRRRPVPLSGSEFILDTGRLVMAIGQKTELPAGFALLFNEKGRIQADPETMACSVKGVYAGGDAVSGPASVIKAIQAGRKAAISIDKYLGNEGCIEEKLASDEREKTCLERIGGFAYQKRVKSDHLSLDKRLGSFSEVEQNLSTEKAVEEARRCLRCQLRLRITKAPNPPSPKDKNRPSPTV